MFLSMIIPMASYADASSSVSLQTDSVNIIDTGTSSASASYDVSQIGGVGVLGGQSSVVDGVVSTSSFSNTGGVSGAIATTQASLDDSITTSGAPGIGFLQIVAVSYAHSFAGDGFAGTSFNDFNNNGIGAQTFVLLIPFTVGSSFTISLSATTTSNDTEPFDENQGSQDGNASIYIQSIEFVDAQGHMLPPIAYTDTSGVQYNFVNARDINAPEPSTAWLLGTGFLGLAGRRRFRFPS